MVIGDDGMVSAGFVSDDGSPLRVYLALPAGDAPMLIHRASAPGDTILELGSGPGRLTRVLVALGHDVVAVDDSPEMLAHVTGAETVCADLIRLDLGRQFGTVVAASHLLNFADASARADLLDVCRRHVLPDGVVLIERHPPGWLLSAGPSYRQVGPVQVTYEPGRLAGSVRTATVTYELAGAVWRQEFSARDIDDELLSVEAGRAGLAVVGNLNDDGAWVGLRAT